MYRKVQVFFLVLYFFMSVVYNESLYYCNSCMLEQISYLGKFWFLRYGPKCSGPIRLQDFLTNRRTLKSAVSHKEINEKIWFLVFASNSFLRNGSLDFFDFWHNGRSFEYWQTDRAVFSRKIYFWPQFGKKSTEWAQNRVLGVFEKNFGVSFSWK